jgi:hypothetical protein
MNTAVLRLVGLSGLLLLVTNGPCRGDVSFSRDVRPILASRCLSCHGPDEETREADLRLDTLAGATADLGGYQALVPGDPAASELLRRIASDDPDERMPPPDSGKIVTSEQQAILREWISAGAAYEQHWAFVRPVRPRLPSVTRVDWPRNAIDRFVLARLEAEGLSPSAPADRYTLIRRLTLDLTGLVPTPEEAEAFVRDSRPDAYERLVDRLLASPHYGERWARAWLDLARYSDTNGYEKDRPRSVWPYRDWVIRALNTDLPFNRFTIEQLAGDMLRRGAGPAGRDQLVATGFHRNTMLNEEGGIDPLEFRFYAMIDRVATTGTVWLGLTVGCAQCHSHKYDPLSQTEFYRLMALLNNADEPDLVLPDAGVEARRQEVLAEIGHLEGQLPAAFPVPQLEEAPHEPTPEERAAAFETALRAWLMVQQAEVVDWQPVVPVDVESNLPRLEVLDDGSVFSSGDITKRDLFTIRLQLPDGPAVTGLRLEALPDPRLPAGGPGRAYYEGRQGDFFLSEVTATCEGRPVALCSGSHSYGKISVGSGRADGTNVIDGDGSTGWSTAGGEGNAHELVLNLVEPLPPGSPLTLTMLFERHFAASLGRFRWSVTSRTTPSRASGLSEEARRVLLADLADRSESSRETLVREFVRIAPELTKAREPIDRLRQSLPAFPTTLVLQERPADNPRPTHRHHRGEYLSPRETLTGGLPAIFAAESLAGAAARRPGDEEPDNRLELARWLVSDANPLVGRVTMNRAWQAIFGTGIVATPEDFGTQAASPSHPELLDWLACEFVESGWSLKQMHRLMVTSATYRQSSTVTDLLRRRDPGNRLLARGPRFRVEAELVRDIALSASGLLVPVLGGPSVFPPQPESVIDLAYGGFAWDTSEGPDRYRRSLYTFSKRTAPFAGYAVFDAPSGETCAARRDRSNTPLQALTLLNDPLFLEMSRGLADRVCRVEPSAEARARMVFRCCLTRPPTESELEALLTYHTSQCARLESGALDPEAIAGSGASVDFAAWCMVARVVLNLDETVTKP